METADCRMALEQLIRYIENPGQPYAAIEAATGHIKTCPHCQERLGYLVHALRDPAEDTLTCQECEDLLPEYLQAQLEAQADGPRWQPVARHLSTCPHCQAVYQELTKINALAYGGQDINLPHDYPGPDLLFLNKKNDELATPLWQWDELGHLIIQFSADLIYSWRPLAYGTAGLKKAASSNLGQCSVETNTDMQVVIMAEEQRYDPTSCVLTMQVNIPSRGGFPNLGGTTVILKRGQETLASQLTDAYGEAVFEKISLRDLPHLMFEIEPEK